MTMAFDDRLLNQGQKLTEISDDSLLEVIGLQLFALDPPSRAVSAGGHLSAAVIATDMALASGIETTEGLLPTFQTLSELLKENRRRAEAYLNEVLPKLKAVMCDNGRLKREFAIRFEGGELIVKVTAEVVAAVTGLPPLCGSLVITVAAWFSKHGLESLCR